MTYQSTEKGYVIWRDVLLLPMKKKKPDEKTKFFKKVIPFEDSPNYWEYSKEGEQWNLYYVKRGVNRRLAVANIGEYHPETIIAKIHDKEVTVSECKHVEDNLHRALRGPKLISTTNWSVEFDGKRLLALLIIKEKMTYEEVVRVITNEGGYVDSEGIIHKGTAENKVREF